ncbi:MULTISPECIES: ABC transporter permease [Thalassospira]|uniref:ABC transporter permease n=2 Tax=Thalassospira tepidiphila TaxID=393657 RepID=A0A853L0H2_9PROT|nr:MULTISPECIES: proline/glycine betaine ABC transporter permease [Thalassospira]MBO6579419.1 proline/glycine betaine ABC transporter permease [Thalassospira sp.]MBO6803215.1 proline/glycine betaine ABC transporter permease [Thalassospira sp.]MBO6820205.1 proline/glycine betaine ABC transporter permease [Thalassospira sp.]MBO6888779.1 proline/glycine betaine ABC transporter permease [Thalassospira sp.]NJB75155.1 glycine betaine/proline transport system permease protein [Thalassospira tepidiphi|tara:strand:+ start:988 stop:1851 length:864 start_codon:yes stop_codon:yes gene_type:complete
MFPEQLNVPLGKWVNQFVDWLVVNYGAAFEAFADSLLTVLVALEQVLRGAPWWVVLIAIAAITWHASKNWKLVVGLVIAMFAIGMLGLWDKAMQTLALMIVATSLSVLIGIPVGIAMAMSNRLRAVMLPILDTMQTMPSFVYLIPALMLFGLGKVPAILATVIYAAPPVMRLTDLGIRLVDQEVLEASRSFGASRKQILFGVQLPLALPNIMAGINQTTMMSISMVVIASMIGARGLGEQVLMGIQRLDVGAGMEAGVAIVLLAVVFDRIGQAYGKRSQRSHDAEDA